MPSSCCACYLRNTHERLEAVFLPNLPTPCTRVAKFCCKAQHLWMCLKYPSKLTPMFKATTRPGSETAVDVIDQNHAKELKFFRSFLVTKNCSPLTVALLMDGLSLLLRPQNTQLLPSLSGQAAECPGLQLIKDLCSLFGTITVSNEPTCCL